MFCFAAPGFELARLPAAPRGLPGAPRGPEADCLLRDARVQKETSEKKGRKEGWREKRNLFQ